MEPLTSASPMTARLLEILFLSKATVIPTGPAITSIGDLFPVTLFSWEAVLSHGVRRNNLRLPSRLWKANIWQLLMPGNNLSGTVIFGTLSDMLNLLHHLSALITGPQFY